MENYNLSAIIAHAKTYGFIYNSSTIYGGLQGVYDYAPHGVLLKRKLHAFWFSSMVDLHQNIVGLDAAILMAPQTWEASGHISHFHDWMVDNRDSKKRYRVDHLLEKQAATLVNQGKQAAANQLLEQMNLALKAEDGTALTHLLQLHHVVCPLSQTANWTEAKTFNLMFTTETGAVAGQTQTIHLRPETAQGIFVNFLQVQKSMRMSIPFGIAQIGKAFRNELIARQFTFRMREFEQMEMQFFVAPGEEATWFDHWVKKRRDWYRVLGISDKALTVQPHEQLAHYASAAVDLHYHFPFGSKEVEGIHSRTDFDLKQHSALSRKKLHYFDPKREANYLPYVIETSAGSDRLLLMLLCEAFTREQEDKQERIYLKFPAPLAPIGAAVLPLLKKTPLITQAQAICKKLCNHYTVTYDERGSIGKRYTRQDLIGTPFCITVDFQTLEDNTVTIRFRDSMEQQRLPIADLEHFLEQALSLSKLLQQL